MLEFRMSVDRDSQERQMTGIIVGVDGSDQSHSSVEEAEEKVVEEFVAKVASATGESGLDITVAVAAGDPAEELLRAARNADMLVVGSRGSGGFARLLLGSVSGKLAHHAACPVVIVPC
jgi:nucleotide-binding universal stress UspA family protein